MLKEVASIKSSFITNGIFNIHQLKPFQLFGLDYLDPVPHALFWVCFFNTPYFCSFGKLKVLSGRNYAEMFVDINKYITMHENAFLLKSSLQVILKFIS
jgi:hypothetical protein